MIQQTFVGLGLGLLVGCSPAPVVVTEPEPASLPEQALEIYQRARCERCHGDNRQGTGQAPPLINLGAYWTEEDLAVYLADPRAAAETSERLQVLAARYKLIMPGYQTLSEDERRVLARYLVEN